MAPLSCCSSGGGRAWWLLIIHDGSRLLSYVAVAWAVAVAVAGCLVVLTN